MREKRLGRGPKAGPCAHVCTLGGTNLLLQLGQHVHLQLLSDRQALHHHVHLGRVLLHGRNSAHCGHQLSQRAALVLRTRAPPPKPSRCHRGRSRQPTQGQGKPTRNAPHHQAPPWSPCRASAP